MKNLSLVKGSANRDIKCSLCAHLIAPGEIFWYALGESGPPIFPICKSHIPLNTTGITTEQATDGTEINSVYAVAVNAQRDIIPKLLSNWDSVYDLTAEEFEELVFDRLVAMELQPFRIGRANQKDGGIDIIFWTRGIFPMLGAVQIKHHRSPKKKTGPGVVREMIGAMQGHHFNIGLIITNTSFTDDAKYQVEQTPFPIQLRDSETLRKWISDDFGFEGFNFIMRTIELCKGLEVRVPRFL